MTTFAHLLSTARAYRCIIFMDIIIASIPKPTGRSPSSLKLERVTVVTVFCCRLAAAEVRHAPSGYLTPFLRSKHSMLGIRAAAYALSAAHPLCKRMACTLRRFTVIAFNVHSDAWRNILSIVLRKTSAASIQRPSGQTWPRLPRSPQTFALCVVQRHTNHALYTGQVGNLSFNPCVTFLGAHETTSAERSLYWTVLSFQTEKWDMMHANRPGIHQVLTKGRACDRLGTEKTDALYHKKQWHISTDAMKITVWNPTPKRHAPQCLRLSHVIRAKGQGQAADLIGEKLYWDKLG
ncbi:hypothetical protein BC835DRAFT_1307904 [Cytidiella melzeri]|nr:hypothetical protein BC835DRAFT_1307904 [Cytidiella melzeri]